MDKLLSLFPKGSGHFSQSFDHFSKEWGKMLQFQTIVTFGVPPAEAKYSDYVLEFIQEMKPSGQFPDVLIDSEKFFIEGKDKEFAIAGAREAVKHVLGVANSMTLLWGHTILENSLQNFLQIILAVSPTSFYNEIEVNSQTVTIKQARDPKFETVLKEKVTKYVKALERDGFITKCDVLLRIVGSENHKYSSNSYKYNREELTKINERRHDVAHGRNLTLTRPQVDNDLNYLFHTFGYFFYLMHEKFDLKISAYPKIMEELKKRDSDLENLP